MSLTLNTNENNIIKFIIGVSGTSSLPSKVRVFVGGTDKKLCFIAKATGIEKEWCAEIPPLTELLNYTSGPLFCSIEIVVNGRTFTPYSKEVNLVEPQQEPIEQTVEVKPEETTEIVQSIEEPTQIEPEVIAQEEIKPDEVIKPEIKVVEVKPLLKDIASVVEPVKVIKEEKAKPKKTFKLKPFNNAKKSKVKSDNKSMKDILVIEDIDLSKISIPTPIIQKTGNSIPFKLTKKNVVYR